MDDAGFVRFRERIRDLGTVPERGRDAETLRRQGAIERPTGHVLHHDVIDTGRLAGIVNGDDAGMIQGAGGLGLMDEALPVFAIGAFVGGQDLDGDGAVELRVEGLVDDPHPALAELGFNPIAVERVTNRGPAHPRLS